MIALSDLQAHRLLWVVPAVPPQTLYRGLIPQLRPLDPETCGRNYNCRRFA